VYVFKPVNTLIDAFATKTEPKSSITVQCVLIVSCLSRIKEIKWLNLGFQISYTMLSNQDFHNVLGVSVRINTVYVLRIITVYN
jgi:hypothetical protein